MVKFCFLLCISTVDCHLIEVYTKARIREQERERKKERTNERTESSMNKNDLYIRLFD